jgi:glycerol transport system ATP-binding protein
MGTPQELFERPQHTFVGYFIGSPGMNVIPAHVEGNQAHIEGTTIKLNYGYKGMSGSNVEIGVRPEFTSLHEGGEGLPITIKRVEDVGRYKIVRADFFGREINITVPEGQPISERVNRVSFDPTRVNVYQGGWIVDGEAA